MYCPEKKAYAWSCIIRRAIYVCVIHQTSTLVYSPGSMLICLWGVQVNFTSKTQNILPLKVAYMITVCHSTHPNPFEYQTTKPSLPFLCCFIWANPTLLPLLPHKLAWTQSPASSYVFTRLPLAFSHPVFISLSTLLQPPAFQVYQCVLWKRSRHRKWQDLWQGVKPN